MLHHIIWIPDTHLAMSPILRDALDPCFIGCLRPWNLSLPLKSLLLLLGLPEALFTGLETGEEDTREMVGRVSWEALGSCWR